MCCDPVPAWSGGWQILLLRTGGEEYWNHPQRCPASWYLASSAYGTSTPPRAPHAIEPGQVNAQHFTTPACALAQPLTVRWPTCPENFRSPSAPYLAGAAIHVISQTCAPIACRSARCAGYSVCNEFTHGPDLGIVWRAARKGRRVSWLKLAPSPLRRFLRANLDRKRQIWPAGGVVHISFHYAPTRSRR